MIFDDVDDIRQCLFTTRDRSLVAGKSDELRRDAIECQVGGGRRDMGGQEEEPSQRVGSSGGARRPPLAGLVPEVGSDDGVRFP